MDRLETMRLFTRIVEAGSFSRAAEQQSLSRASASLLIKQLEQQLGTRLLLRTTRQVRPTVDGQAYYLRCRSLLNELDDLECAFKQAARLPQGRLKINLSGSLCRMILIPALPEFCARFPEISLEIGVQDKQIDLVSEGVDCVLRIGELRDSALVARPLGKLQQLTCASAGYLAKFGTPCHPEKLAGHRNVDYISASSGKSIPLEFVIEQKTRSVQLPATLAVNNGDAYVAACEADFGLIQVPYYHVRKQLAAGSLVEVLADYRPPALPLNALYPQNRHLSPRLRVFIDWLVQVFERQ